MKIKPGIAAILAAGPATRMGRCKATITIGNKTLLEYIVESIRPSFEHIVVVTGAWREELLPIIENNRLDALHNPQWETGMASSIAAMAREYAHCGGLLFSPCDTPLIPASHFQSIKAASRHQPGKIIASEYRKARGIPTFFPPSYIPELASLTGQEGARAILDKVDDCVSIDCPECALDADNENDLQLIEKRIL